jgi:Amt family ammonium transporter
MSQQSDSTMDLNSLPYVPLLPYNGTTATGGNSLTDNLNVYYQAGDIAWMLTSTALVLLMIPGVGYATRNMDCSRKALSLTPFLDFSTQASPDGNRHSR